MPKLRLDAGLKIVCLGCFFWSLRCDKFLKTVGCIKFDWSTWILSFGGAFSIKSSGLLTLCSIFEGGFISKRLGWFMCLSSWISGDWSSLFRSFCSLIEAKNENYNENL